MTSQQQKHEKQEAADSKKELQLTAAMEELKGDIEELKKAISAIELDNEASEIGLLK